MVAGALGVVGDADLHVRQAGEPLHRGGIRGAHVGGGDHPDRDAAFAQLLEGRMSRRSPDHLMNETRMSTWSVEAISTASSRAICGSTAAPVKSDVSACQRRCATPGDGLEAA